jgi:tetratricopeptide (TPR) repeat protein
MKMKTDNGLSTRSLGELFQAMLGESKPEEMLEKLKELALKTISQFSVSDKDEIVLAILEAMECEVFLRNQERLSDIKRTRFFFTLKDVYEAMPLKTLPKSRLKIMQRIFNYWTPDPEVAGYLSIASDVFLMMIRIYDEASEDERKVLDEDFKLRLLAVNWELASKWLLTPSLTEGLGNHLAKARARNGKFWLALSDVKNANFLNQGLNFSPGAFDTLQKTYADLCHWEKNLSFFRKRLEHSFTSAGYTCKMEIIYDYPSKITIIANLGIPAENTSLVSFDSLTKFVNEMIPLQTEIWLKGQRANFPENMFVEVFEREELIGKINVFEQESK